MILAFLLSVSAAAAAPAPTKAPEPSAQEDQYMRQLRELTAKHNAELAERQKRHAQAQQQYQTKISALEKELAELRGKAKAQGAAAMAENQKALDRYNAERQKLLLRLNPKDAASVIALDQEHAKLEAELRAEEAKLDEEMQKELEEQERRRAELRRKLDARRKALLERRKRAADGKGDKNRPKAGP